MALKQDDYAGLRLVELRERVLDDLASHYAGGDIGMEGYDERCGKAANLDRRDELISLLSDLPDLKLPALRSPSPVARGGDGTIALNEGRVSENEPIINIFFGTERKGVWKPAKAISTINIFGGTTLDLSRALIPPGGLAIHVICVFGGCEIIIPEGMRAEVRGIGVFGGFSRNTLDSEDESGPLLRVDGVSIFGGCEVKTKRRKRP